MVFTRIEIPNNPVWLCLEIAAQGAAFDGQATFFTSNAIASETGDI